MFYLQKVKYSSLKNLYMVEKLKFLQNGIGKRQALGSFPTGCTLQRWTNSKPAH